MKQITQSCRLKNVMASLLPQTVFFLLQEQHSCPCSSKHVFVTIDHLDGLGYSFFFLSRRFQGEINSKTCCCALHYRQCKTFGVNTGCWLNCVFVHCVFVLLQHPFIKAAKPSSILRALITDAMEIKLKKVEAEQREQDQEDEDNSVHTHRPTHTNPTKA